MNEKLKETYNRIAEDWNKDHESDVWWLEGAKQFASLLPEGSSILDIGCGVGIKSRFFSERGFDVLGIDFAEKQLDIARQSAPKARFQAIDIYDAPSAISETFDGLFMQASLLHIPRSDAPTVVRKLTRLLAKGGHFLIAVKGKRIGGVEEEIKKEDDYGYEYERFFSYFTLDEIKEYLKAAGLEIVYENVSRSGKTDWVQVVGYKSN